MVPVTDSQVIVSNQCTVTVLYMAQVNVWESGLNAEGWWLFVLCENSSAQYLVDRPVVIRQGKAVRTGQVWNNRGSFPG
jgi:hypothetical protein